VNAVFEDNHAFTLSQGQTWVQFSPRLELMVNSNRISRSAQPK
jgi:hypothetical protein